MASPSQRYFADAAALAAYLGPDSPPSLAVAHEYVTGLPGVVLAVELWRRYSGFAVVVDYTSWVLQGWGEVNHRITYEFAALDAALVYLRTRFGRAPHDIAIPGQPQVPLDLDHPPEQGDYQMAWQQLNAELEAMLRAEANDPTAWERLALFLELRGDDERREAARIRLQMLAAHSTRPAADPEERARALEQRADLELRASDYVSALADLEVLCELEPEHAGHRGQRIECLRRAGRHSDVIAACTAEISRLAAAPPAARDERNLVGTTRIRGEAYYWLGDHARARLDYEAAIRIDPNDAAAWANLAEVLIEYGELDRARMCIDRAWDIGDGTLRGFVQLIRGDVFAAHGELSEAVRWWNAAAACGSTRAQERLQQQGDEPSE